MSSSRSSIERDDLLLATVSHLRTALHYAALNNTHSSGEVAAKLISSVSESRRVKLVWALDFYGCTAFHCAAQHGAVGVMAAIVHSTGNACAHAFYLSRCGWTALHYSAVGGQSKVIEWLRTVIGTKAMGKLTLKADLEGRTALHEAVNGEVVSLLLDCLSNRQQQRLRHRQDKYGMTAVTTAIWRGDEAVVERLFRGAQPSTMRRILLRPNKVGSNLLHTAAGKRNEDILDSVLEEYLKLDLLTNAAGHINKRNHSPVHYMIIYHLDSPLSLLLQHLSLPLKRKIVRLKNSSNYDSYHYALTSREKLCELDAKYKDVFRRLELVRGEQRLTSAKHDILQILQFMCNELTVPWLVVEGSMERVMVVDIYLSQYSTESIREGRIGASVSERLAEVEGPKVIRDILVLCP